MTAAIDMREVARAAAPALLEAADAHTVDIMLNILVIELAERHGRVSAAMLRRFLALAIDEVELLAALRREDEPQARPN
jgi:hypothetical protein